MNKDQVSRRKYLLLGLVILLLIIVLFYYYYYYSQGSISLLSNAEIIPINQSGGASFQQLKDTIMEFNKMVNL